MPATERILRPRAFRCFIGGSRQIRRTNRREETIDHRRLSCKSIVRDRCSSGRDKGDDARYIDDNSSRADRRRRCPGRPPTSRPDSLFGKLPAPSLVRGCTLRLGLLTTDLLRARQVPRPRGTCQRFRSIRPLFSSPRGDIDRRCCAFLGPFHRRGLLASVASRGDGFHVDIEEYSGESSFSTVCTSLRGYSSYAIQPYWPCENLILPATYR